jgi:predicted ArsR family transcriptional regulator
LPQELDPQVNAPVRLAVLSMLAIEGPRDFSTIKQQLGLTDGALGTHLKKLARGGYVKCQKAFFAGKPRSTYFLATAGRAALVQYLGILERLGARCQARGVHDRLGLAQRKDA